MEFNKRKFNIIVAFTVCLIFLVVIFSAMDLTGINMPEEITSPTAENGDPIIGGEEEEGEEQGEIVLDEAPTFTAQQKWILLSYAMDKLNNTDYKMYWNQTIVGSSFGVSVTQKVDKWLYCVGDQSYVKANTAGLKNFTEYTYIDGKKQIMKIGGDRTGTFNYDAYIKEYGMDAKELPYTFGQSTCTIDKFVNDPLKDYYQLEITLNPTAYQKYVKVIKDTSGGTAEFTYIKIKLVIDKQYAIVKSMAVKEKYVLRDAPIVGTVECDSTITLMVDYTHDSSWDNVIKESRDALGLK
ncbi:MAG: hypothetical protein PHS54_05790 [Clostridia bacterium]|nr:hypothetical protein [Clostridia bacterium]